MRIQCALEDCRKPAFSRAHAGIAQLVEQLICNQQVVGSNPSAGSPHISLKLRGVRGVVKHG